MTATAPITIKDVLDKADPNNMHDAFRLVKLGTVLTVLDVEIENSPTAAAFTLDPPALLVQSVEVTDAGGGAADLGVRVVGSAIATPAAVGAANVGVCSLSADGATITLEGDAAKIQVVYIPRPDTALTEEWAPST